jgi:hypothetical protein
MAQQTIRRRAEELGTVDANAAWQQVRVAIDPRLRADAATVLAEVATDAGAEAEIRELWGPAGPKSERELDELLRAYLVAGRQVPAVDRERAFQLLMASPLPKRKPAAGSIGFTLAKLPDGASARPDFFAWLSAFNRPGLTVASLDGWSTRAATAFVADAGQVPDARWFELLDRIAETLIDERRDPGFAAALVKFDSPEFERLCMHMGQMLAREVEADDDRPLVAEQEFRFWAGLPIRGLADLVLPEALRPLSQKEVDEVGKLFLAPGLTTAWEEWAERHPRTGARVTLARVFRRGGKDRDGGEG